MLTKESTVSSSQPQR